MKLFIYASILFSFMHASAHHTEQFYQSGQGQNVVTPFFSYTSTMGDFSGSEFKLGAEIERGLTKTLALAAKLHLTDNGTNSGIDRIHLTLKGHQEAGLNWRLHALVNTDTDKPDSVQNQTMSFAATLGYELDESYGFRFDFLSEGKDDSNNQPSNEVKVTGFYETNYEQFDVGYSGGLLIRSKSTSAGTTLDDAANFIVLRAYPSIKLNNGTLIAGASYQMYLSGDLGGSGGYLTVDAAYRMLF